MKVKRKDDYMETNYLSRAIAKTEACCRDTEMKGILKYHPCFSREAHHKYGRIHVPVAPACNIQCRYCVRKFDCANESRPGVTSRILTPEEGLERIRAAAGRDEHVSVVGIAGPGDPLANDATFELLDMARAEFPQLILCLSTNGLLLTEKMDELARLGVKTLTVTINAVTEETAGKIYKWALHGGKLYEGPEAGRLILKNQWEGLRAAVSAGFAVKVNTILMPGLNEEEITAIAEKAGGIGADLINIMALIPQGDFAGLTKPSIHQITRMRHACLPYINIMSHCRQCRADACGTLGQDGDMETEALMARIGEEYEDAVF
jgi:nitrogen fixation protein NifB